MNVYFEPHDNRSTHFFKTDLLPLIQETDIGDRINLLLVPFGRAKCNPENQDYSCVCTRGYNECNLMHLMSCTLHDYKNHNNAVKLIVCMQEQPTLEKAIQHCTAKLSRNEVIWLSRCSTEFRGKYLSWINGRRTKATGLDLPAIPTIVIDGGSSPNEPEGLRQQICARLRSLKPSGC